MGLWHKRKGRTNRNLKQKVKKNQEISKKKVENFWKNNGSRINHYPQREYWEGSNENRGQREIDFYKNVSGVEFFIAPDEMYQEMQQELDEILNRFKKREYYDGDGAKRHFLEQELSMYRTFKKNRGFLNLEEATQIASQVKEVAEISRKKGKKQHVLVNLSNGESNEQTYVEISKSGRVKLPCITRILGFHSKNLYGKTDNYFDIIDYCPEIRNN